MLELKLKGKGLTWMDFDIEARPLSWYGGDFVTKEVTAIACKFIGENRAVDVWALGEVDPVTMLTEFHKKYDEADGVAGHFIRSYDLIVLNGAMIEFDLPPLGEKLTHDTKNDLVRMSGISKSQESLGAMFGLKHPKISMDQTKWREANRLTKEGIALTKKRVVGDVKQNIELRAELLKRNLLSPPKMWYPMSSGSPGKYQP